MLRFLPIIILLSACGPKLPEGVGLAYEELPKKVDFNFDVRPILSDRCFSCHGPDEKAREAGLRLDIEQHALAKLSEGEGYAIVAGRPAKSQLVHRILSQEDTDMMPPPDSKLILSDEEKAILIKWIKQGAEWKDHWAYIPPIQPPSPKVSTPNWAHNFIDPYILERLDRTGLTPNEEASKATLIRRLSLDLIGLPPTIEEVDAFESDTSEGAYEKIVDRLLADPRFGERWCWEWLDAARYADTNGFQGDPTRKMWPWRDWVIDALNENMPYDQFTVEQMAGDLLPNATQDQVLATGFNRNHMYNGEGGRIPEETRVENVFDRVETMGTIWLGLTVNCSRCHDHKFDALTQKEYYQFYDYFNQTSEEGIGPGGAIPPILDLSPQKEIDEIKELTAFVEELGAEVAAFEERLYPHKEGETPAESPKAVGLDGDQSHFLSIPPAKRGSWQLNILAKGHQKVDASYVHKLEELREVMIEREKETRNNLRVMVMDQKEEPRPSFILAGGVYDQQQEQVSMGVPAALPALPENAPSNRLGLAQWLVDPKHPLTARVTVNRFWQAIFGTGLVKTTEDFGVQGEKPSHPELLDALAVYFVENNWDVKKLIKTMVMSATYRQSSVISPEL